MDDVGGGLGLISHGYYSRRLALAGVQPTSGRPALLPPGGALASRQNLRCANSPIRRGRYKEPLKLANHHCSDTYPLLLPFQLWTLVTAMKLGRYGHGMGEGGKDFVAEWLATVEHKISSEAMEYPSLPQTPTRQGSGGRDNEGQPQYRSRNLALNEVRFSYLPSHGSSAHVANHLDTIRRANPA